MDHHAVDGETRHACREANVPDGNMGVRSASRCPRGGHAPRLAPLEVTMSLSILATALLLAAPGGDAPLAPGRASGTLTVQGQKVALAWAYARVSDPDELEVVVTDRALPEERLDGEVTLERAAQIAQASRVRFYLRAGRASNWLLLSPAGGGGGGSDWDDDLRFDPEGGAEVAGRLSGRATEEVQGLTLVLDGRLRARRVAFKEVAAGTPEATAARERLKSEGYALRPRDFFQATFADPSLVPLFIAAGMPADTKSPETDETVLMNVLDREGDCDTEAELGMVRALLKGGADANQRDASSDWSTETPLERAYPCAGAMGLVFDAGGRLDAPTGPAKGSQTVGAVLMKEAIADGDAEVVGLLIERGFDVRPKGAALLAEAGGKPEIVALLRRAGARPAAARPTAARAKP